MKKVLIIIVGIAVLAVGGYSISNVISKSNANKNTKVVKLENGQELRINNSNKKGEFEREGDRPDVIGKIKEINGDSIVVEQFDMSNVGIGRGDGRIADGQASSERPTPIVSGEVKVVLVEDTSYVKGAKKGMGMRGENQDSELEEISKDNLEEGDVISIWALDGEETAERIMVR